MRTDRHLRHRLLAAETRAFDLPTAGRPRLAVGYPGSYEVGMSSLSFQWVIRLTLESIPGLRIERFFSQPRLTGSSLESESPLSSFDVLAWTLSFENDAVEILRTLDGARIPRRSRDRARGRWPLLVVGGPVAVINPLPLAPVIDVFVLGAAERLWPPLLQLVAAGVTRDRILEELAGRDGYFVPIHHLGEDGRPTRRLRRLERHDQEASEPRSIPASWATTPHSVYRDRGLVEISRGCPEKCRYCWASFNSGRLRCYPLDGIVERLHHLRCLSDRVGFVATAVGDHPELPEILEQALELGLQPAVSSLRIPAMRADTLRLLARGGARSVTIAPETGNAALRGRLGKRISNECILEAVEAAQSCGLESLKMYFIVGLPGETDDDLESIVDLLRETRTIMNAYGRDRGRLGELRVGLSLLVPKPYTPYARVAMLDRREARSRIDRVAGCTRTIPNLQVERPSYRHALWQGLLGRGDATCFDLLAAVADGQPLASVLRSHVDLVEALCLRHLEDDPASSFLSTAPVPGPPLETPQPPPLEAAPEV